MGRDLYHHHPTFAHALDEACAHLDPHLPQPLKPLLFAPPHTPQAQLLNHTLYTQPALFAFQTALHHLLTHHGITPTHLIGHSIGEITAAHTAGILTLPDAATLVTTRARLMNQLPPGAMITAHTTDPTPLTQALEHHPHTASIAATNTPDTYVISGDPHTIDHLTTHLEKHHIKTKKLHVSHAFHSPHMEPILEEFHTTAQTLTYHPPHTPLISNTTGQLAHPHQHTNPHYWTQHIRQPVHFTQGITTLHHLGTTTYLELTPHPTLTPAIHTTTETLTNTNNPNNPVIIPLQHHNTTPNHHHYTTALATLHTHGTTPNWTTTHTPTHTTTDNHPVPLPTYPFQHQTYWLRPA
ncbi:acyltransferase domain-containing protein, partial [Streptomyces malaysiense]|uniref:acyltransferase domain-containing protein n=1 Tax=Streptomyces malaysiense TaxID=1428626 RepID=UPI001F0B2E58